MDLCSAIVYCVPKQMDKLISWLSAQDGVDVHQNDVCGKIIITAEDVLATQECESKHATEAIAIIQQHPDVISVMLVSQFSDTEEIA